MHKMVGIGNAIVDIVGYGANFEFEKYNIAKGSMALVDDILASEILMGLTNVKKSSGGSVANTISSFARLGAKTAFLGRIGNDENGKLFAMDMSRFGADFIGDFHADEITGTSVVILDEMGERTMATNLATSVNFDMTNLRHDVCKDADFLYIEGYLFDSQTAKIALLDIANECKNNELKKNNIGFNLSDVFLIERYKDELTSFITKYVDVLIGNEAEFKSFFDIDSIEDNIDKIRGVSEICVITLGDKGAIAVIDGMDGFYRVSAKAVNTIDTTGAGDQFAAGFLYGIIHNYSIEESLEMGAVLASEVIQIQGARIADKDLKKLIL